MLSPIKEVNMFFKKKENSGLTAEIRVKRCYGCGAILQDKDPNEIGYVPPEKFESGEETLCERCYKLRHYSSYSKSKNFNLDYITILSHAKEEHALAVYVLNAFCLNGSFLDGIGRYLPENVLVVVNKRDCLPENYSDEFIKAKVQKKMEEENIKPKDIILTSASVSKNENIDVLLSKISNLRCGKSVYFFGAYQVGKSSLINALLMDFNNKTEKMITTSPYPGTTLDVINIPLDSETYLYDTPGIYNSSSMVSFLEPTLIKYVLPRNQVRPETYMTKEGQSFVLYNLMRIDMTKGDKTNLAFFKSNDMTISRCKINKADSLVDGYSQIGKTEIQTEKVKGHQDLVKNTVVAIPGHLNTIRVFGLMFIEFNGKDQEFDIYVPQGVKVTIESDITK